MIIKFCCAMIFLTQANSSLENCLTSGGTVKVNTTQLIDQIQNAPFSGCDIVVTSNADHCDVIAKCVCSGEKQLVHKETFTPVENSTETIIKFTKVPTADNCPVKCFTPGAGNLMVNKGLLKAQIEKGGISACGIAIEQTTDNTGGNAAERCKVSATCTCSGKRNLAHTQTFGPTGLTDNTIIAFTPANFEADKCATNCFEAGKGELQVHKGKLKEQIQTSGDITDCEIAIQQLTDNSGLPNTETCEVSVTCKCSGLKKLDHKEEFNPNTQTVVTDNIIHAFASSSDVTIDKCKTDTARIALICYGSFGCLASIIGLAFSLKDLC